MTWKSFGGDPAPSAFVLFSTISFFSDVIIQAQDFPPPPPPPPPRWVNGILGGSVLLPLDVTPEHILNIEWRFGSGALIPLGQFKNRIFNEFNFSTRFHQRLQMYNETTLRVDGLEMRDTGTFEAHITFTTGYLVKQDFHLTVYEPVPTPEIRKLTTSRDSWNITLECMVSPQADVNITWIAGALPAGVEELQQHWQNPNRNSRIISLNCNATDRPLFCVVSNPVDMKNTSYNLSSECTEQGGKLVSRTLLFTFLPITFIAIIVITLLTFFYWKKKKKRKHNDSASRNQVLESSSSVQYAVIQRIPPEGNDQIHANLETNLMEHKPRPRKVQTVYDEVKFVPKDRSMEAM
ncbi:SLAM family member 8 isoform X1 [Microcaecilia unicolor]|uniref:SLAM family member 8-like isoform X1 n=1 Tax=Microcaecilia unicolor TaxID=1415580 RepID=A0A6P7WRK3_9AMPH|nr:SLAM family member 8-like isoform X1 [Microcaecilia unicolor]